MRALRGRALPIAVVSAALAIASLVTVGPASAQTVQTGTLSFTSDPGDYIGGGQSASYDTSAGDGLNVTGSTDDNSVHVGVNGANGDWWYLDIAAPQGQTLAPGTYTGATRYPFQAAAEPGLSLYGNGRGCNTLTGSFMVQQVVFGPNGYVQNFDATFEQHCEGSDAALRGEVHITNPAPPPVLDLGLSIATDGTASTINGNATVHGSVTCTKAATVNVSGTLVETYRRVLVRGTYSKQVDCVPGAPVAWSAVATPTGDSPFRKGKAEATTQANGYDADYNDYATTSDTTVVTLSKSQS
ncbi:MAG: hypothetical protein ACRDP6_26600 [Actinoallomurus sp.]